MPNKKGLAWLKIKAALSGYRGALLFGGVGLVNWLESSTFVGSAKRYAVSRIFGVELSEDFQDPQMQIWQTNLSK